MEKEFVTYEQALSLKDLGFNEGCFAYWWKERQEFPFVSTKKEIIQIVDYEFFYNLSKGGSKSLVSAPTFSQAFRWFDKFNSKFIGVVNFRHGHGFIYTIYDSGDEKYGGGPYLDRLEAEQFCLDKLINIANTQ